MTYVLHSLDGEDIAMDAFLKAWKARDMEPAMLQEVQTIQISQEVKSENFKSI